MIALLLSALVSTTPLPSSPPQMGVCTAPDAPNVAWPRKLRRETQARVQRACHDVGASKVICAFADAIVIRESSGRAGVRHRLGHNEHGLGAMGLSLRWHRDKWPGRDEDPQFCKPEVSFAVAHAVMWRAVTRYKATTLLEIQAIYEGRWFCFPHPTTGKPMCRATPTRRTRGNICGRMRTRGFSCDEPITRKDLGRKVDRARRRDWALSLFESFGSAS